MEKSTDTGLMSFNDLLVRTGGTGLFQVLNFLILGIIGMFTVEGIYITFIAAVPDHWCKVEELQNLTFDMQKNVAIPSNEPNDLVSTSAFNKCKMFNFTYSQYTQQDFVAWNRTIMAAGITPIGCTNGWTYDKSQFATSIVSDWDLVCDKEWMVPLVSTAFTGGMFFGAVICGSISDRFGRKPALVMAMMIKLVGGLTSAFVQSYAGMIVTRFIIGFGSTATYLLCFVLTVEVSMNLARTIFGTGLAIFYSFGYMLIPGVALAVRDWRRLSLVMACPSILGLVIWWVVPESPRWLLVQRRYKEADKVMRFIAKVNQKPLAEDFDISRVSLDEDTVKALPKRNLLDLFRTPKMRKWTLIVYLHWFTDTLVYYAMSLNSGSLAGDIFLNTFLLGLVEIPANVLLAFAFQWRVLGRRLTSSFSLLFTGVVSMICITLIVTGTSPQAVTALSIIGKGAATMAFSGAYVYTGEIFPTEVRNVAMGSASTVSRISGMAAPFVGGILGNTWKGLPYLVYGCFGIISGLLALYLPETLGKPLCDTIEETENAGKPEKTMLHDSSKHNYNGIDCGQNDVPSSLTHRNNPAAYVNESYVQESKL